MTSGDQLGLVGQEFSDYLVLEFINSGQFGQVYSAKHSDSGQVVALKVLMPGASVAARQEFENEAKLLLRLTGARRVVDILDSGTARIELMTQVGQPFPFDVQFHVLELAVGCLEDFVTVLDQLEWPARLALFRDVVLGVHQMHLKQVAHRDLKTSNCLLFGEPRQLRVKLSDLGRSRDVTASPLARVNDYRYNRGDPDHSPPELLAGVGNDSELNHKCADLYGLGSLLCELTLGVQITALALYPRESELFSIVNTPAGTAREALYRARIPEIRDWFEDAFVAFEESVPAVLKHPLSRMIRQLCDPDPRKRVPQVPPGKRAGRGNDDLSWLLRRLDICKLLLRNSLRQAESLARKKGS